jgi:hypothetical protein
MATGLAGELARRFFSRLPSEQVRRLNEGSAQAAENCFIALVDERQTE